MKKKIKQICWWLEDRLKDLCGELTPDKRIAVTITMLLLFTALSLYFTVSSIYRFGKGQGEQMQIQHIEKLELELRDKQHEADSIKQSKDFQHERE